ncbi:ATP-dependent RNA helicase MAK5 [Grifola frondosa]|uniref:RNA helicase n=1 Tax=Grifola frondosa TaxID=5627 RepID=A0A1C7LWY7_GRIFR|nr:ATP-dependent RNA helicase MAK5 [Grifola frondosa]
MPTILKSSAKRKSKASPVSRKRAKTVHRTADDLPWKTVSRPRESDLGNGLDGLLELEEVDDVQVVYEETDAGRVIRFKVAGKEDEENSTRVEESVLEEPPFDTETLLPNWHSFNLHPQLCRALYSQKFASPTPIQSQTLPLALKGKDIVGVAETGSGKTLAYGLPILHYLLTQAASLPSFSNSNPRPRRDLRALILAPTRELALQVSSHLNACLNQIQLPPSEQPPEEDIILPNVGKGKSKKNKGKANADKVPVKPKLPPLVSVAAIVGGMSAQKQRRILARGAHSRCDSWALWDILQEDDDLANQIERLRFIVLDEADRMIEAGHFVELDNILRLTLRQSKDDEIEPEPEVGLDATEAEEDSKEGIRDGELQTFVFSATFSKDLQKNLKKHVRLRRKNDKPSSTLDDLLMKLDFRDPKPAVVDLSPVGGVVATLRESKIECLGNDKDAYLYYFLLRYPGRSLVFLSSIDGIRRLLPLMDLLGIAAFPLHSQLEQRQRLKNLDRFKSTPRSVLLATDVAARGLDVPAVDHVVHYQVPRTADTYVHRNGRTARAMRRGFSLLIVGPDERKLVRALMGSLTRQEEIPEMPVELYLLDKLKTRIQLARQIDVAQHRMRKEKHDRNWLKEAAEAMEIELDSDLASELEDEEDVPSKRKRKDADAKTGALKAELKQLLAQPLVARGVSTRYITSGTTSIVDDILAGEHNEAMVGLKRAEAGSDLVAVKKRKPNVKDEFEEWTGFGAS